MEEIDSALMAKTQSLHEKVWVFEKIEKSKTGYRELKDEKGSDCVVRTLVAECMKCFEGGLLREKRENKKILDLWIRT